MRLSHGMGDDTRQNVKQEIHNRSARIPRVSLRAAASAARDRSDSPRTAHCQIRGPGRRGNCRAPTRTRRRWRAPRRRPRWATRGCAVGQKLVGRSVLQWRPRRQKKWMPLQWAHLSWLLGQPPLEQWLKQMQKRRRLMRKRQSWRYWQSLTIRPSDSHSQWQRNSLR